MATTNCPPHGDPNFLDVLVTDFYRYHQPVGDREQFWVALLVQAECRRRDLDRSLTENHMERDRFLRELELLQTRRTNPPPARRLHIVPLPTR